MRTLIALLLALVAHTAHADEPIRFVAEVADEALAEDAILLVHCLATRTAHGWELDAETHGSLWLKVAEQYHRLNATFHSETGDKSVTFSAGGSDSACSTLSPAPPSGEAPRTIPSLSPLAALSPASPLSALSPQELVTASLEEPHLGKTWLWIGGGIAAIAGGYILLHAHSHRPNFSAVQMN